MSKIEDIKARILKLRQMVPEKGASEAEALAALDKADKLMSKHNISEAALRAANVREDMSHGEFAYGIKTQHPCAKWCSKPIGRFCGVVTWYDPHRQSSNGFGFNEDVEMYKFLLIMVHDTMNREWKLWLKNNPKEEGVSRHTQYWGFMWGMSETITNKIYQLMNEREQQSETGTDLVVLKEQVIEEGMKSALPSHVIKPTNSRGVQVEIGAMKAGLEAGNKVNLNRPIPQSQNARKSISHK